MNLLQSFLVRFMWVTISDTIKLPDFSFIFILSIISREREREWKPKHSFATVCDLQFLFLPFLMNVCVCEGAHLKIDRNTLTKNLYQSTMQNEICKIGNVLVRLCKIHLRKFMDEGIHTFIQLKSVYLFWCFLLSV